MNQFLWAISERTTQTAIDAALKAADRRHWQPARLMFRQGEKPEQVTLPTGVTVEVGANITPNHFMVVCNE